MPPDPADRRPPVGEPARERHVEQLLAHHLGATAQRLALSPSDWTMLRSRVASGSESS